MFVVKIILYSSDLTFFLKIINCKLLTDAKNNILKLIKQRMFLYVASQVKN